MAIGGDFDSAIDYAIRHKQDLKFNYTTKQGAWGWYQIQPIKVVNILLYGIVRRKMVDYSALTDKERENNLKNYQNAIANGDPIIPRFSFARIENMEVVSKWTMWINTNVGVT